MCGGGGGACRVPEDTPGLVVQWHFDDLKDSPDDRLALSAQNIPLYLADSTNLQDTACGGTTRPIHAPVAAPLLHTDSPYIVVSYIPTSAVDVTMPFDLTVAVLPTQGTLTAGGAAVSASGTAVPANTTLVYCSPWANVTSDDFMYTALVDGNAETVCCLCLCSFTCFEPPPPLSTPRYCT